MQSGLIEAPESAKCKVTFAPPDPIVPTRLLSSQLCRWARRGLRSAVLLAFLPTLLFGKVTGSISGTVKDSTGAVIPGANVEARNVHTGVIETSVTDAAGFYNFATLPVGTYDVSVNKDGFTGYQEKSLVIDVDSAL